MNKDNLIDILIDWVEEDKKLDTDIEYFINVKDITNICSGGWMSQKKQLSLPLSDRNMERRINMKKYIKIKESISKNGWDKSYTPCLLEFIKSPNKNDKQSIGYIIVRDGNHRIAIMENNNLNNKIYTKFIFGVDEDAATGYGRKAAFEYMNYTMHGGWPKDHPYFKKIQY